MPSPSTPSRALGSAWKPRPNKTRGTAALSRDAVVTAAIRLVDDQGVGGLTMRRVAAEIGAGVTTLYWHVADKEELLDLVCDAVLSEIRIPRASSRVSWQRRIRQLLADLRRTLLSHRDLVISFAARPNVGPNALALREAIVECLQAGGLTPTEIRSAERVLVSYTMGACCAELAATSTATVVDPDPAEIEGRIGEHLARLPPDRYPNLVRLGHESRFVPREKDFLFGVDCLLAGLETQHNEM